MRSSRFRGPADRKRVGQDRHVDVDVRDGPQPHRRTLANEQLRPQQTGFLRGEGDEEDPSRLRLLRCSLLVSGLSFAVQAPRRTSAPADKVNLGTVRNLRTNGAGDHQPNVRYGSKADLR